MILSLDCITEIRGDMLFYTDSTGTSHTIDLRQCARGWAAYFNENLDNFVNWNDSAAQPIDPDACRCVGERDWFAKRPYFLFYCEPQIRFELVLRPTLFDRFRKHWRTRYHNRFYRVQAMLAAADWTTFDLG